MAKQFRVKNLAGIKLQGVLFETPTAAQFWFRLPFIGWINRYGGELYLDLDLYAEVEDSRRQLMRQGELAYWPDGSKVSIFAGDTPISQKGEIRAIAELNVFGRIIESPESLLSVAEGDILLFEKETFSA